MKRLIRYFDKNSDLYIGHFDLPNDISLAKLQEIFNVESTNPMYDCWPITKKEECFFVDLINIQFNFEAYEYFLECDA